MSKYLVIELQTAAGGEVAHIVTVHDGLAQAQSKYHAVLSAAAISGLPAHAAVLMTGEGYVQEARCFGDGAGE